VAVLELRKKEKEPFSGEREFSSQNNSSKLRGLGIPRKNLLKEENEEEGGPSAFRWKPPIQEPVNKEDYMDGGPVRVATDMATDVAHGYMQSFTHWTLNMARNAFGSLAGGFRQPEKKEV
jgi:hypothetical protein